MTPSTTLQNVLRIVLGTFLFLAGVGHLTFLRAEFQAQVPDWVPVSKDLTVILSGVVEVLLGLALIFIKKQRRAVGWITALFFVLVFPGNIAQFINGIDAFGLNTDLARGLRLVFQPLLIIWALWSTQAWPSKRHKSSPLV